MSEQYVKEIPVDRGENIHIRCIIKPKCEHYLPFTIKTAKYELLDSSGDVEAEGECTISEHEIDAKVEFKKSGIYYLKFTYCIADETWVDKIRIRVG